MKTYTIKIKNIFGAYTVAEWVADNKVNAVKEFLELNPDYKNKGSIIAVEK